MCKDGGGDSVPKAAGPQVAPAAAVPAAVPPPVLEKLSPTEAATLKELEAQFPEEPSLALLGFLRYRDFKVDEAATQLKAHAAWRASTKPVTIADVAPFMRAASGAEGPDGCLVCLEDGRGGCARDHQGRPILASIGMPYGTVAEQEAQMIYAMQRAEANTLPGQQVGVQCMVIETAPRKGAKKTFRFPDKEVRGLMDLQKAHFPSSLMSVTHFCGIPSVMAWSFNLCRPFMDKQAFDSMKLWPSYKGLKDHMPVASMLPQWGGTFDFDLEAYIQWRAAEEGVELPPAGLARRYTERSQAEMEADMNDAVAALSAKALITGKEPKPSRWGRVSKQGSGRGWFSNTKWKEKLMVCAGSTAVYFNNGDEHSDDNKADRVISLLDAQVRAYAGDGTGPAHQFEVVTPVRNYVFGCETAEDRDAWIAAVQADIVDAAAQMLAQTSIS